MKLRPSSAPYRACSAAIVGLLALLALRPQAAAAQAQEQMPLRVVFLGGDGRLVELSAGPREGMGKLVAAAPGRLFEEPSPGWVMLERQPLGRGFLGLDAIDLSAELLRHYRVPAARGVMVSTVSAGSPAAAAGVEVGDVMVRLDGEPVIGADALRREIRGRAEGDRVEVELYRAGERRSVVAVVEERERPLIRLEPTLVAPRQLELRVDRLDRTGELVEIRVEELLHQLQRVLGSEASLALRAVRGAERENIERRMREVERELEALDRRLRAAGGEPR